MLIPSPRHTAADLRLWAELEEADRDYAAARRDQMERLAARAVGWIRAFAAGRPCYLGTSWGKDSVVLMHLAARAGVSVPAVWVRFTGGGGIDNPDCLAVRDEFLGRYPAQNYAELSFRRDECPRDQHWRECDRRWGGRRITGLRTEESGRRALSVRHLGASTERTCRPLAWWTGSDVFAWIAAHDLPAHPAYAMLGGGRWPREQLRCHSIGGETGTGYGRREWEREYYGDVLRRLAADACLPG